MLMSCGWVSRIHSPVRLELGQWGCAVDPGPDGVGEVSAGPWFLVLTAQGYHQQAWSPSVAWACLSFVKTTLGVIASGYFRRPSRRYRWLGLWHQPWEWIEVDRFKSILESRVEKTWWVPEDGVTVSELSSLVTYVSNFYYNFCCKRKSSQANSEIPSWRYFMGKEND